MWRPKLVNRMMEGVPKCMIRWFKSFLEDRKAQVRLGHGKSKWMRLQQGLPQGAVSSPVLLLLYVNKWDNLQEDIVEYSGFADDIAVWAKGTDLGDLRDRLEKVLRKIEKWAGEKWGATNRLAKVLNAQVRSGHCPRTKYYRKRFGEAEDRLCEDCGEEEDRDHLLKCPRWEGVHRHMMIEDVDAWRDDYLLTGYLRRVRPRWFD